MPQQGEIGDGSEMSQGGLSKQLIGTNGKVMSVYSHICENEHYTTCSVNCFVLGCFKWFLVGCMMQK